MRNFKNIGLLPILLFVLLSCGQKEELSEKGSTPVLFSMDTKSLGAEERTYRVGLFNVDNGDYYRQGTYCSELLVHTDTGTDRKWLSPCRVDDAGGPLDSNGDEAAGLAQADKNAIYGLRWGVENENMPCKVVAATPAVAYEQDGSLRFYTITPSTKVYLSDAELTTFYGSFLGGQYVYQSSTVPNLTLKDRRSRIYVQIECDEVGEAFIQKVTLLNHVNSVRWYMTRGFSEENYTTDDVVLYDCGGGSPYHLIRENSDYWKSALEVFLPAIDFSNITYAALRPQIEVKMGSDVNHPIRALVSIAKNVEPMNNYTFYLYVSKSAVSVSLSSSPWDDGGGHSTHNDETPAYVTTVSTSAWDTGGTDTAQGWNDHF